MRPHQLDHSSLPPRLGLVWDLLLKQAAETHFCEGYGLKAVHGCCVMSSALAAEGRFLFKISIFPQPVKADPDGPALISYVALLHGFHFIFYSFRASAAHITPQKRGRKHPQCVFLKSYSSPMI
jgi:hypothetical protein